MLRTFRWQSLIYPLLVRLKYDAGDSDVALGRSLFAAFGLVGAWLLPVSFKEVVARIL